MTKGYNFKNTTLDFIAEIPYLDGWQQQFSQQEAPTAPRHQWHISPGFLFTQMRWWQAPYRLPHRLYVQRRVENEVA